LRSRLCSKKFRSWLDVRRLVRSLRGEQAVWSRSSPPSSLPKPRQPSSIGNRPFLRGFSPVSFRVFGLCGHSRSLEAIFCARSLHPEIPFPAARGGRRATILGALSPHPKIPFPAASLGCAAPQLFRVESERLKLPAPLSRWIAEALDADAAR
jgi:hypothetical protein